MELTVPKRDLLKLVSRMNGIAARKSTMPVLSNVLLSAEGSQLHISATDLYLSLAGCVSADVKKLGSVALPAKDLFERVKMMPDGPVSITSTDGASTVLKASGSARRYTLRGVPGSEFPPLPKPAEGSPTLSLDVDILLDLIAKTHFSVSMDETRAHLNAALFEWTGDTVRMVSTDGHRLTKVERKVPGRQATATMLIPLKGILELRRLCEDVLSVRVEAGTDAADVKVGQKPAFNIAIGPSNAFFQNGGSIFSVKLVDSTFPPFAQVIPQTLGKKVHAPRAALADAVRAVSVASDDKTCGVKLELSTGRLTIRSESPEHGDGSDEVPVEYSGSDLTIGFNAKYLLDALSALLEDDVFLSFNGELDPAVVRPDSALDWLGVLMPMRV